MQNDLSIPVGKEPGQARLNFTRETDAASLAARLGALGIPSASDPIVLYHRSGESQQENLSNSSAGLMGATRAWWAMTSWGFTDVRVLDGGLNAWTAIGGPTAAGPAPAAAADFDEASLSSNDAMVATADDVLAATDSESGVQIMDTLAGWPNTAERYGKKFGPERSGHITKAHNVPCGELLQADGTFKSLPELREYFEAQGTDLSVPLIAY